MRIPKPIILIILIVLMSWNLSISSAKTLSQFGAVGDGIANDTLAIKKAFASREIELDGEGKSYRVFGTLEINKNITLKNMKFLQGEKVVTAELMDEKHPRFLEKLRTRTLMIRSRNQNQKLTIHLENLSVNRGGDETQGLASDSAGIWLGGVTGTLRKIEITGNGPGMGIMIVDSEKMMMDQIKIHDMTWRPWNSKNQLDYESVSKNWNSILSWELSNMGEEVFPNTFFEWQRIQEKIAGIVIVRSENITLQNSSIHHLQARFQDGRQLPYQTDGITVSSETRNIHMKNLKISHVWEGIDLTGNPLFNTIITNSQVTDAHAFGFKMANGARNVTLDQTEAIRCGLSGYVISGKNNPSHTSPASGNIFINHSLSKNTGSNGYWHEQATIAGYRIMTGKIENPSGVRIMNSKAVDNQDNRTMLFGFHEEIPGNPANSLFNVKSIGHLRKESHGF